MPERPAPDPTKLLSQWEAFTSGDELPGRTMANLKTGEVRQLLEAGGDATAALLEVWMGWEKGRTLPADTLTALDGAGLGGLLTSLSAR